MTFQTKLAASIKKNNSLLCIGLDSDLEKIPETLKKEDDPLFAFNKALVDKTNDLVCAYKLNIAFYSAYGLDTLRSLKKSIEYIKETTEIPVILDAKRNDIGNTSELYAKEVFDFYNADAVTVNPFVGFDGIEPFLKKSDKGIIIYCRSSNPGAKDFQDLQIQGKPLYQKIAEKVVEWNKQYNNCLLVVGATWPEQMKKIREIAPDMIFLVPGIGAQGGDLEKMVTAGLREDKSGLIINSARSIIYASAKGDFANKAREQAEKVKSEINRFR